MDISNNLDFIVCEPPPEISRPAIAVAYGSSLNSQRELKTHAILIGNEEDDMAHSLPDIEKDALRLSPRDRARLAVRLLSSLEGSVESPEEIEKLWMAEAERRFQKLRDGVVQGVPADEVFAEFRNKRS